MELADVPVPQAKGSEAVVKVNVAGVNSIDSQFRDGRLRTPLPFIPGHEGAGVVTEIGPAGKSRKVGDRVAWSLDTGIVCGIYRHARRASGASAGSDQR